MNKSLTRVHLGLAIFYGLVTTLFCALHLSGERASGVGVVIITLVFGTPLALHCAAMRGVRAGLRWGRTLSRVLGILMLFAIPIGTFLGAFVLMRTGSADWEQSA